VCSKVAYGYAAGYNFGAAQVLGGFLGVCGFPVMLYWRTRWLGAGFLCAGLLSYAAFSGGVSMLFKLDRAAWKHERPVTFGPATYTPDQDQIALPQDSPTYNVASPTILAFFTPVSASGPKEAGTDEALADFEFYGQQALKPLAKMGVDYKEIRASGFMVKIADAATSFRATKGVGYYLVAPGKKARVEYGVMTDSDLLQTAHNYFGVNDNQH